MRPEHRKSPRRKVRNGARMIGANGSVLGTCVMIDLSATGAQLQVKAPDTLPDELILLLSHDGQLRRPCSVAWRSETAIGVRFVVGSSR